MNFCIELKLCTQPDVDCSQVGGRQTIGIKELFMHVKLSQFKVEYNYSSLRARAYVLFSYLYGQ